MLSDLLLSEPNADQICNLKDRLVGHRLPTWRYSRLLLFYQYPDSLKKLSQVDITSNIDEHLVLRRTLPTGDKTHIAWKAKQTVSSSPWPGIHWDALLPARSGTIELPY